MLKMQRAFNKYVDKLGSLLQIILFAVSIRTYEALQQRHDYFASRGCTIAIMD